jgi:hypothetical protein
MHWKWGCDMTFDEEIYAAVCEIWPTTNVRSFSVKLGRSTGYWNSVKSQNLRLSDMALRNLQSTLETQIIMTKHDAMKQKMHELQHKISRELVRRFVEQLEADDAVLEELERQLSANQHSVTSSLPMPIFITHQDSYNPYR